MGARADALKPLRGTLAGAAVAIAAALAVGAYAQQRQAAHAQLLENQQRSSLAVTRQLAAKRADVDDGTRFAERYAALEAAGRIGGWDKLAGVDHVVATAGRWNGRVDRFSVTTLAAAPDDAGAVEPGHRLRIGRVGMELDPLHEPDLLAALRTLAAAPWGRADAERCEIRRRGAVDDTTLQASCQLGWYYFERAGDGTPTSAGALAAGAPAGPSTGPAAGPTAASTASTAAVPPAGGTAAATAPGTRRALAVSTPAVDRIDPERLAAAIPLERLFLTPLQRRQAGRTEPGPAAAAAPGKVAEVVPAAATPRRLGGFVRRDDGSTVVWVDGQPAQLDTPARFDDRALQLPADLSTRPLPTLRLERTTVAPSAARP